MVLTKLHTFAVNVSSGREEDPGRTRSAGYQLVCIACALFKKPRRASELPDGLVQKVVSELF